MPKIQIEVDHDEFRFIEKFVGIYDDPEKIKNFVFKMGLAEMLRTTVTEGEYNKEWMNIIEILIRGYDAYFDGLHEGAEYFGKITEILNDERSKDVL